MWAYLGKFRGGIGVRVPRETQLEPDRRLIGSTGEVGSVHATGNRYR